MDENWKVIRTFADGITPENYVPPPDDVPYPTKEQAADVCVELIAEDLGVDTGDYDPELWSGLSWEDHAKNIREALMDGGHYEYANLKWEIRRS